MKIVIDGIFFHIANTGIARVWRSVLAQWCDSGFIENIILIDRGHTAPQLQGAQYYHLPTFNYQEEALFSTKLQEICDQFHADLFISTYYTTPLSTPSLLMIHDMIPEVMGWDLREFWWREKNYAILYANQYIAVSNNTAQDLMRFYPEVQPSRITVIHNGVDKGFHPAESREISGIKTKFAINASYLLLVGTHLGANQYKNGTILFEALKHWQSPEKLTIVCVGGNVDLQREMPSLPNNVDICLIRPTDEELKALYSGAIALVYPSLYEGFGLPILEAMACGCPVITCHNSSLPEVGKDAVIYIDGQNKIEMIEALEKVQNQAIRNELITKGKERAKKFPWSTTADKISDLCLEVITDTKNKTEKGNFISLWQDFRQCQVREHQYLSMAETIQAKNIAVNDLVCHLENEIENNNYVIAHLQTENQQLQDSIDKLNWQIEELLNTKKTLKRLCRKVLKKLFRLKLDTDKRYRDH
jgi:glycosyltransferase involved in cell wall biosynthesis